MTLSDIIKSLEIKSHIFHNKTKNKINHYNYNKFATIKNYNRQ